MASVARNRSLKERLVAAVLRFLGLDDLDDFRHEVTNIGLDYRLLEDEMFELHLYSEELDDLTRVVDRVWENIDLLTDDLVDHIYNDADESLLYGGFGNVDDYQIPSHGLLPTVVAQPLAAEPLEESVEDDSTEGFWDQYYDDEVGYWGQ